MPKMKEVNATESAPKGIKRFELDAGKLTPAQKRWLNRGVSQPGGKLPLFDDQGRQFPVRTIRSCIDAGWAEPWFSNPIKPDWLVCKLTPDALEILTASQKNEER
ncbi:hypothetical protein [Labrenzia sp. PHM005]|uniref:hypothetical protein n=1 Tax=Labrenzia sp. PHM005 TaxID=2590016 RepID=UPI00113FF36E|nr:hypothetical protein [Labrenzia sp. PHM005]QDG76784.1 hypothetical protein FJ695_13365 [Labrenzia sp. PHM005]